MSHNHYLSATHTKKGMRRITSFPFCFQSGRDVSTGRASSKASMLASAGGIGFEGGGGLLAQ